MVTGSITTHIPIEASPDKLLPFILQAHEENITFESVSALQDFTFEHGLGRRSELNSFAIICGLLVKKDGEQIQLTNTAHFLAEIKSEVRTDIAHYLIYTAYDLDEPRSKTESWAYQQVVDSLWERSPISILSAKDAIVEEVNNSALQLFEASISFSPKSIRGARKWLEGLSPPVIERDVFTRRNFCHPELLLLALGTTLQREQADLGIDLLLTPARREAICRLCVLEPAALDKTLNWMLPLYPQIVLPGTTAGTYGRFLRFLKWPTLADLAGR